MRVQAIPVSPFPSNIVDLRYIEKGDTLGTLNHQKQAADIATNTGFFFGVVTAQIAAPGFTKIALIGNANAFTGNNSFTGTSTFSGASTFNGIVTLNNNFTVGASGGITVDGGVFVNPTGTLIISGVLVFIGAGTAAWGSGTSASFNGTSNLNINSNAFVRSGGFLNVQSGGTLHVLTGATFTLDAQQTVTSTGSIRLQNGASIVSNTGSAIGAYALTVASSAVFSSATIIYTDCPITINVGTTINDASTTARTGPTIYSGDNGRVGGRIIKFDGVSGRTNGDANLGSVNPWRYNVLFAPAITANRTWTLQPPPDAVQSDVHICFDPGDLNPFQLTLIDGYSGNGLVILGGNTTGVLFSALLVYSDGSGGITQGWHCISRSYFP